MFFALLHKLFESFKHHLFQDRLLKTGQVVFDIKKKKELHIFHKMPVECEGQTDGYLDFLYPAPGRRGFTTTYIISAYHHLTL